MDDHAKALPLDVPDPVAVAVAALEGTPPLSREQRRSRRHREVRASTISTKRMTKRELELGRLLNPPVEGIERPRTRAECVDAPRPCPFVSCKHHLYLDVSAKTGAIKVNFPDLEVWEMDRTCALDVADQGGATLERVGELMNFTRERTRQVETKALAKVLAGTEPGDAILDYVAPGPVGKRRLPILQARDEEEDERLEEPLEDDELDELAAAPAPPPAAFDVDSFVGFEDLP
jgi:hypothetical protein